MPASGKSTAGARLAQHIGYGLIDCDLLLRGLMQMPLAQIIATQGAEQFLAAEERLNCALACVRCVIATGGSAVYSHIAMEHLASIGTIVYLRLSAAEIERRIPDLVARGVVMRGGVHTVDELYRERIPLYERYAQYTVDCDGKNIEETAGAIASVLGVTG